MKPVDISDPLLRLKEHLTAEARLGERENDFDMNDDPEDEVIASFPEIRTALRWLEQNLTHLWRVADREALKSQKWHRLFTRVAISSGTSAIVLAIVQLSIRLTFPRFNDVAVGLELIAVLAALAAVMFGLLTKFDRKWLAQRCKAERLRMLKFRSLARLGWSKDQPAWEKWVREQIALEESFDFSKLEHWSKTGGLPPELLTWNNDSKEFAKALTVYYRIKRLNFQAGYFNSRREKYERQTQPWRRLSLRIFFGSVVFVIAHVIAEWVVTPWLEHRGHEVGAEISDLVAVGCLTMAAILPVLGLGVRAWFAAFQLPLSASLYSAKHEELVNAVDHLTDTLSPDVLVTQMEGVEHNLNLEHREWLRLLLETEWFL